MTPLGRKQKGQDSLLSITGLWENVAKQRVLTPLLLSNDDSLDERLFSLQDASWSVVALLDTSATVQERYTYTAFGRPTFLDAAMTLDGTASAVDSVFLFTGHIFDVVTRQYLCRLRWLSPLIGCFTARDPFEYINGPTVYTAWFIPNNVDPTGANVKRCECVYSPKRRLNTKHATITQRFSTANAECGKICCKTEDKSVPAPWCVRCGGREIPLTPDEKKVVDCCEGEMNPGAIHLDMEYAARESSVSLVPPGV